MGISSVRWIQRWESKSDGADFSLCLKVSAWLVVGPPLWKIWLRQLRDEEIPNINGKMRKMATKPPTSIIIACYTFIIQNVCIYIYSYLFHNSIQSSPKPTGIARRVHSQLMFSPCSLDLPLRAVPTAVVHLRKAPTREAHHLPEGLSGCNLKPSACWVDTPELPWLRCWKHKHRFGVYSSSGSGHLGLFEFRPLRGQWNTLEPWKSEVWTS